MVKSIKQSIFVLIYFILIVIIEKSNYVPLIITAYLLLVFPFLQVFNYVNPININLLKNEDNLKIKSEEVNTAQLIFSIIIQVISFLFVFLITWYVFSKKVPGILLHF